MTSTFNDNAPERRVADLEHELERARRERRELMLKADLLDIAQQAVIVTTLDGVVTYINHYATELYGWTPEEVTGRNIMTLTVTDSSREHAQEIMAALAAGETWHGEFEVRRKDGTTFPAAVLDAPLYDERGELVGIIGLSTDISETRRWKGAARLARSQLQRALETANMAAWSWSLTTDEVQWSPEVAAIIGLSSNDLSAAVSDWVAMIMPEDLDAARDFVMRARAGEQNIDTQCRILGHDQIIRHIYIKGSRQLDGRGRPMLVGIIQDVSEQVHARQRNRELQQHLEQLQRVEAIGRLAGGVAHDINNLLTGILMSTSVLEELPAGKIAPRLARIVELCERGRDLTTNLLGFARKGKYRQERVDLRALVEATLDMLGRTAPTIIELRAELPAEPLYWWGDEAQLRQLVLNLSINAVDALCVGAPAGEAELRLVAARELATADASPHPGLSAGEYVRLDVIDNGCGMDAATLRRALDPFFTTKPKGRGTGLGLAMAYGVTQNHGGALALDSTPGEGTTVHVWIPAAEPSAVTAKPRAMAKTTTTTTARVLLVDDDPSIREACQWALEELGYETVTAGDGREALDRVATDGDFDLVILDLVMPEMDGAETFRALHRIDPELPIMLISGHSKEGIATQLLAAGAVDFLQKPFGIRDLERALGRVLLQAP